MIYSAQLFALQLSIKLAAMQTETKNLGHEMKKGWRIREMYYIDYDQNTIREM